MNFEDAEAMDVDFQKQGYSIRGPGGMISFAA